MGIIWTAFWGLGLAGIVLQWFQSYVKGRFSDSGAGDCCCTLWCLANKVLQSSVFSPMLFNIYLNPLGEVIWRYGLSCQQYTGDTQPYLALPANPRVAVETEQVS